MRPSTPKWTWAQRTALTSSRARLNVSLPGREREVANFVVDAAEQLCPYSNATRGNIEVAINLV